MTVRLTGIPEFETARLRLRAPSEADFEAECAFYASNRAHAVGGPYPRADVWRRLASVIGHWVFRGYGFWAVDEKASGAYCGRVGLWNPEGWPEPEIGWTLMAHAEGRGIAHEAALAARGHAYGALGWKTAISLIAPGNARSLALAARLGAVREADYRHPTHGILALWRHPGPEAQA